MRKFSVFSVLSLMMALFSGTMLAQDYRLSSPPVNGPGSIPQVVNKRVVLCGDTAYSFTDGGGASGNYANNVKDTIRFESKIGTRGVVEVSFTKFQTSPSDTLFIFSVTGANALIPLDTLRDNLTSITGANPRKYYSRLGDKGLAFRFSSDATVNNPGWEATVREASAPTSISLMGITGNYTDLGNGAIGVCLGSSQTFQAVTNAPSDTVVYTSHNGSPTKYGYKPDTTANVTTGFTYNWNTNEPANITGQKNWTRTWGDRFSYNISVDIITDKCRTLDTTVRVNVSTTPSFSGTSPNQAICEGQSILIVGRVTETTSTNVGTPTTYTYKPTINSDMWDEVTVGSTGGFDGVIANNQVRVPANTAAAPDTFFYRYKVVDNYGGVAGCAYDTVIRIILNANVHAGKDSIDSYCASTAALQLNNYRGAVDDNGNGTGRWIDFDNSSLTLNTNSGQLNIAEANARYGTSLPKTFRYVYKINGDPGCGPDSSITTLTIYPAANAGKDTTITSCNNVEPINLLSLLRTNQGGGNWNQGAASGRITNDFLDPKKDGNPFGTPANWVDEFNYQYRYDLNYPGSNTDGGCQDTTLLVIQFKEVGDPGASRSLDICSTDPLARLFDSIPGTKDNTGTWTTPSGYVFTGTAPQLDFNPGDPAQTNAPFSVTYTVRKNNPTCPDSSSTLTINYQKSPNSGSPLAGIPDVCTDANTFNLFSTLDGSQDNYGLWSIASSNPSLSGVNKEIVNLNTINFGVNDTITLKFTYTVNSSNVVCNTSSTDVFVRFTRKSNAGTNRTITVCENAPVFMLKDSIGGPTPDLSTTFSGGLPGSYTPTDFNAIFDPGFTGLAGTTVVITATDTANGPGCSSVTATLTINVSIEPVAGANTDSARVCVSEPTYDLSANLDNTITTPGYWTLAGGIQGSNPAWLSNNGIVTLDETGANGFPPCGQKLTFEYHATADGCVEVVSTHTLEVFCKPNAGLDDSVYVCSSDPIFALKDFLTTSDQTGKWEDLDGSGALSAVTSYTATFNPDRVTTTGEYRMAYIVSSTVCSPSDTAFITVFVSRLPRAGVGDTSAACEDETNFDLYSLLTGNFDRRGKWELAMIAPYDVSLNATVNTAPSGTYFKGADGNEFDVAAFMNQVRSSSSPFFANRPTSFPPYARFKYTVQDTTNYGPTPPICRDSVTFATLQISKIFATPTLKQATPVEVCKTVSAFNLNSLVNGLDFYPFTADDKIIWTDNSGTITAANIQNDTIIAPSSLPAGDYTFTLSIQTAACPPIVVNNIKLRIVSVPNAGNSNSVTICTNSTPVDIRTVVGGESGGSITKVQPTTPINGLGVSSYNPIDGPGTYVFEYKVVKAACPGSSSTANATIQVLAPPVTNGNQSVNICFGDQLAMRTVVPTTDPIATFSPNSTSGDCAVAIATNSPYNSALFNAGLPGFAAGATCVVDYTADNGVCPAVTNQITVNIGARPDAGDNVVDTVCSTNNAYALVPGGTPTAGGVFSSSSPAVSGSNFNATLVAAPTTVTAIYVVGGGACPKDTARFTLYVERAPQAGTDGSVELCAKGAKVDMRTLLNGQVDNGGIWTAKVGAHQPFLGGSSFEIFDPVVFNNNFPGVNTFSFDHIVRGTKCPDDIATLTIRIVPAPKSGRGDTTVFLCTNGGTYSLFNALGVPGDYDLGGTWTGNGGPTSSFIDPSSYGVDTVTFVYSVPSAKCGPSNTVVTAIINAAPNSGKDRPDTLFLCAQGTTNLNQFLINGANGGFWEMHSGAAPSGNFSNGVLMLSSADAGKKGTFRYITRAQGCSDDTAFFKFNINGTPTPLADPNIVICRSDVPTDLKTAYASFPNGGVFSLAPKPGTNNQQAISTGALNGSLFYSDYPGNGVYEFTLTTPGNGCISVQQKLTVTVVGPGVDTSINACISQNSIDLFALTKANGIQGVWNTTASVGTVPGNLVVGNIFFPQRGTVGTTYTSTLTGSALGCNAVARITTVDTISITNMAGTVPAVDIICDKATGTYQVQFKIKGGLAPYAVSGTNGNLAGTTFTSDPIPFGAAYNLRISSAANCGDLTLIGSSECGDADGDGIFDLVDLDDDNDGLPDLLESGGLADANGDHDGDGTPNYKDADYCTLRGGSMGGQVCKLYDFDEDGIINQYDLDSDNDGISDVIEGFDQPLGSSYEGSPVDGKIAIVETGVKNGWHDAAETFFGALNYPNLLSRVQKTTAGLPDYLNIDSDGDSIADFIEGGKSITVLPPNTDGTGKYDFRDLDSDDDGVADIWENGRDGDIYAVPNSDNDAFPDFQDNDADNDGLVDGIDSRVALFAGVPDDFDGDGLFNHQDDDSDNDNILDIDEKGPSNINPRVSFPQGSGTLPDYLNIDSDHDGICDIWEGHLPGESKFARVTDTDGDGNEDFRDLDSDNDGIPDAVEGGVAQGSCAEPINTTLGDLFHDYRSLDADGDGLSDNFEAGLVKSVPVDSDQDNIYDFQDLDSDNDCIPDKVEAIAPYDKNFVPAADRAYKFLADASLPDYLNADSDGDGLTDEQEAGPDCANPIDSDSDLYPNFRDLDADNDGASDRIEGSGDCDGDGTPNYADFGDNCDIITFVPEGFSPNNDGVNDFFVIPAINEFPLASLKIYNRWGQLIFESSKYDNRWDGKYNGEDVPQGTYFYLLDLGLGEKAQKGSIYINR